MVHTQDKQVIRPSKHEIVKGRHCLIKMISLSDKVTCIVDERMAVDFVCLKLNKVFDSILHKLFSFFISDLEDRIQCILNMFVDDTKLSRSIYLVDCRNALQRDLDRLDQLAKGNKTKCWVLYLGHNNLLQHYELSEE